MNKGALTLAPQPKSDRYGRTLAQVFADGVWVQADLVRSGLMRASPGLADRGCGKLLLKADSEARDAKARHWGDGVFSLRTPDELRNRPGSFQIVEGNGVSASVNSGRAFIDFGADYRSDFTLTVSPADMRTFRQERFDVKSLSGKRIWVRGWIESYNGPEMEIATPLAIEVLNESRPDPTASASRVR